MTEQEHYLMLEISQDQKKKLNWVYVQCAAQRWIECFTDFFLFGSSLSWATTRCTLWEKFWIFTHTYYFCVPFETAFMHVLLTQNEFLFLSFLFLYGCTMTLDLLDHLTSWFSHKVDDDSRNICYLMSLSMRAHSLSALKWHRESYIIFFLNTFQVCQPIAGDVIVTKVAKTFYGNFSCVYVDGSKCFISPAIAIQLQIFYELWINQYNLKSHTNKG